ncbi:hypothetical protein [Methylobacterium sp. J-068]|uniref:hypothetical protein n=1 Tax=Methylobacterium sp. J-068 TaxID=2836649 RepID=UPI001FB9E640|nr:hypothetical protein [Methylobacterium sp. J-068]MCJ2034019.1 hypothetical protein [Methylobacterium sp. J-068]
MAREIRRLEALAARRRLRVRVLRALRGTLGAGATLATLVKLKLAGSLALKLGIAALVGLGLAWPFVALALVVLFGLVVTIVALFSGENISCPEAACDWGCDGREKRGARLKQRIAERRAWLAAPSGPAPSLLRLGGGRKASP